MDFLPYHIRHIGNRSSEICSSDFLYDLTENEEKIVEFYSCVKKDIVCFPFVRESSEYGHYYEIVFYDPLVEQPFEEKIARFIFIPGKRLNIKQEEKLIKYLSLDDSLIVDETLFAEWVNDIKCYYSDVHMLDYLMPEYTIAHLYFSFQRGTTYELLFKAGLHNIASFLPDIIDGANLIAKSPSELFDMPHKLLRLLNQFWAKSYLKPENREYTNNVYNQYSSCIESVDNFLKEKWDYLCWLYDHDMQFDIKVYRYLDRTYCISSLQGYMHYLYNIEIMKNFYKFSRFPKTHNLYILANNNANDLVNLVLREEEYDKKLSMRQSLFQRYFFEDDERYMYAPCGLYDFCKEAESQKNDYLLEYAKLILEYEGPIIIFVRNKTKLGSYASIEIDWLRREIVQVYGSYNKRLNVDKLSWLTDYACEKGLTIRDY